MRVSVGMRKLVAVTVDRLLYTTTLSKLPLKTRPDVDERGVGCFPVRTCVYLRPSLFTNRGMRLVYAEMLGVMGYYCSYCLVIGSAGATDAHAVLG
jgi:hypothetical protein